MLPLKLWEKLWNNSTNKQESCRTLTMADSKGFDEEDTATTESWSQEEEAETADLELTKLMIQAETALNAGKLRESLGYYDTAIELLRRHDDTSIALANVCYTSSRIAKRLRDFHAAYTYTILELSCVEDSCADNSVVASSHSELAHMCHYELGDSERALQHYKIALGLHCVRLQDCRKDVAKCCQHHLCDKHKRSAADIKAFIQETKECIGRIQFGMGMVADALRML